MAQWIAHQTSNLGVAGSNPVEHDLIFFFFGKVGCALKGFSELRKDEGQLKTVIFLPTVTLRARKHAHRLYSSVGRACAS